MTSADAVLSSSQRVGVDLTEAQARQLERYLELLERWNRTINLTALPLTGFPAATLDRLVGEPLAAAHWAPSTGQWVDIGTGGGSPAIPLKIVRPGLALTMVESRDRKSAFLREVVRELQLEQAEVRTERAERLVETTARPVVDLVSIRAVRLEPHVVDVARTILRPGGRLLLFGHVGDEAPALTGFVPVAVADLAQLGAVVFIHERR